MASIELQGRVIDPDIAEEDRRLPPGGLIPHNGSYKFTAVHHHQWEYYTGPACAKGGEWLPAISELRHVAGGNGVTAKIAGGPTNASAAYTGMANKRSVVIRHGDPRLGQYAKYLARYDMRNGRVFWVYAWVAVRLINQGRNAVPRLDHARMVGFRRQCVAGGIVDAMPRETLDQELLVIENRISRWRDYLSHGRMTDTAYAQNVGEASTRMEAMVRAYDRQFGEADTVERGGVDLSPVVLEPALDDSATEYSDSGIELGAPPTAMEKTDHPRPRGKRT